MTPDQQRRLFIQLRSQGKTQEEAARMANEAMRESKNKKLSPTTVVKADYPQETKEKIEAKKPEIPADWKELPWPELRAIAEKVSGGPIRSRAEANSAIEAAQR